ncbi:DeoR/GlpR family DNA-binding transcription regulator [uncultured Enorma sp.]|uniref:DeoR/GlpR family DNA-binding transcription regulator n=1 Tax=uncultured Enorma sp. TaxID=1714346 RepID=UPI00280523F7|nr:DeoR/GlpR family DNA-binding transcription regulator [uncultured Enorma sp.]
MKQMDERQNSILELLNRENKVYVPDLSEQFNVSEVTIRKDLKDLEDRGLLRRVHGGAERVHDARVAVESTLGQLMLIHMNEKQTIARAAFPLIEDGDAVLLDASTTTRELARLIRASDLSELTIITPAPEIALDLCDNDRFQVILIGGILRPSLKTSMGPIAIDTLKGLHADKAFIGVNGIDIAVGLTTQNLFECEMKRRIIESSTRSYVLADASKTNTVALGVICPVSAVDYIVTDEGVSENLAGRLEEQGVEVIIARN